MSAAPGDYQVQWVTLHQDIEKYERVSMMIKTAAVLINFFGIIFAHPMWSLVIFTTTVWLLDAIWKTFQGRIEAHILQLEKAIQQNKEGPVPWLYSEFEQNRPNTLGLVMGYLKSALRPTVAYPYAMLIFITVLTYLYW